jgi:hypothetical protein
MFSAYDQPNGNSSRTDEFAYFFSKQGNNVKFFTNNFCHFRKKHVKKVLFLWSDEKIKNYKVVWLKTSAYQSNVGFARVVNMWQNLYKTFLYAMLSKEKPDVIIAPSVPITLGFIGCIIAKILNCRMIYEIRDLWPEILADIDAIKRSSISFKLMQCIEVFIYTNCNAIVSTLPNVSKYIKNKIKKNIFIQYIPNGLIPRKCNINKIKIEKTGECKKIMYFGGYGLDHDVESIVQAAKILNDKHKNKYKFYLFGDGPKKSKIMQNAKKQKIKNVFFFKPVPKTKIPLLSKKAGLLLAAITDSPSYRFGINLNKLLSYFLCVKPILFSGNSPNNPVKMANAGVCVPASSPAKIASAIEKIFCLSSAQRLKMAKNGYSFAIKNLRVDLLGKKYLKVLNRSN